MCQIALSKSTEKVFITVVTAAAVWTVARNITQTFNKNKKNLVTKKFKSEKNFSHKKSLVTKNF